MKKLVIVINGAGGVGKDTVVEAVATKYKTRNISSVEPIKELARQAGWTGEKDNKSRKMLSDLKRLFTEYNDLSFRYIREQYGQFLQSDEQVMFVHIREPEEIARFVETAPHYIKTMLVTNHKITESYGNSSDDNVGFFAYDKVYHNDRHLDEVHEDFLWFFDTWFERCSFDTEPVKVITAKLENGVWSADIEVASPFGCEKVHLPKCYISLSEIHDPNEMNPLPA